MSPEQKAVAGPLIFLALFAIVWISLIVLYGLHCGHNGVMVGTGVAMIAGIVGLITGHKLRDIFGK